MTIPNFTLSQDRPMFVKMNDCEVVSNLADCPSNLQTCAEKKNCFAKHQPGVACCG